VTKFVRDRKPSPGRSLALLDSNNCAVAGAQKQAGDFVVKVLDNDRSALAFGNYVNRD
jgi:hypothetical protein